jgi:cyclopropane fatty-acyl-phospholipid synthase-like methyltransferase
MHSEPLGSSYDDVPYESHAFPQTHPDRLATVATLVSLRPAPTSSCRLLELGSAAGGNIIPLALTLPDATFIGVDASRVQIAEGQETARELGLSNVDLRHASILDINPDFGKFDYIICHGVYSWVPTNVQDKILDICARNLNPNGIAYVTTRTPAGTCAG